MTSSDPTSDSHAHPSDIALPRLSESGTLSEAQFAQIYQTLREMAAARMARERPDAVLQPTVLVHEVLIRMLGNNPAYRDRVHFLAAAAIRMRAILVDHARSNLAAKHGGGLRMTTLRRADAATAAGADTDAQYQVLALHQALEQFASYDPRATRVVELSFFGGMNQSEIATLLEVSVPTIERDLRIAKGWLRRRLEA